jgi:uncharacterized membrane protein YccF (DUF307 family)
MTQQTIYSQKPSEPGCLVRALWFYFIGIPVGLPWTIIAWLFMVTIIGLPVGLWMLNRLPQIVTLKSTRRETVVTKTPDGTTYVRDSNIKQRPFLGRALYFVLVGFWLSLVWLILAWVFAILTLGFGLPAAFWMFNQVPALTTLARQ